MKPSEFFFSVSANSRATGPNVVLYVIHNLLIISDGFAIVLKTSIINFCCYFPLFRHSFCIVVFLCEIHGKKDRNALECASNVRSITHFGMQFKIIYSNCNCCVVVHCVQLNDMRR